MKLYKCSICGQVIQIVKETDVPLVCCGREMEEIIPNTVDAASEKHVPVIKVNGNKVEVKIGSLEHPMEQGHYIEWIVLKTKKGYQFVSLKPGKKPEGDFELADDDEIEAAYAYCNIHALWKSEYKE